MIASVSFVLTGNLICNFPSTGQISNFSVIIFIIIIVVLTRELQQLKAFEKRKLSKPEGRNNVNIVVLGKIDLNLNHRDAVDQH